MSYLYSVPSASPDDDIVIYAPLLIAAIEAELDRADVWDETTGDIEDALGYMEDLKYWIATNLGDSMPTGAIVAWMNDTPPPGWLLCDGSPINRAAHPELFALLYPDVPWDDGFLPDFTGRALIGAAEDTGVSNVGTMTGSPTVTLTPANVPPLPIAGKWGADTNHIHASGQVDAGLAEAPNPAGGTVQAAYTNSGDGSGGAVPVNIQPPSVFVWWIIKT